MNKKLFYLATAYDKNSTHCFISRSSLYILFFLTLFPLLGSAQVGINTTDIDFSAILEIESTDKGVLFPNLSLADRDNLDITAGADLPAGLIIYCTDCCRSGAGTIGSLYYYNGLKWNPLDSDCAEVGVYPDCTIPTEMTDMGNGNGGHWDLEQSTPLLFDNLLTNATQPEAFNFLRLKFSLRSMINFLPL